jgi:hypothetical protein
MEGKNMSNVKVKIAVALALVVLVAYVAPAWAVDYNPGVSKGQWVKYGNFVGYGSGSKELNDTDYMKLEVTDVSGKVVTLHSSGKYENGTNAKEYGYIINVETGTINGSSGGYMLLLIAANLNAGDALISGGPVKINKTETRNYMSVSRSVNILNFTSGISKMIMTWDKASGMIMEIKMEYTGYKMSFSATDTNIFATGVAGWIMDNLIYIVIAIIVIVVIIGVVFMIMRKPKAPPPPAPETQETPPAPSET